MRCSTRTRRAARVHRRQALAAPLWEVRDPNADLVYVTVCERGAVGGVHRLAA
ncbi:MAG: hypothetical protein KY467_02795 [Gemmatimonadetes bacterium]|nr:hypothetical protein [Gemmatimonadota bacterium]